MRKFMPILILLVATSCSAATGVSQPTPTEKLAPSATSTAISAPAVPSSTSAHTNPTVTAQPNPSPSVQATTARGSPTTLPKFSVTATVPSTSSWKTFTSADLHIALDYPPDWTVQEDAAGVTFTSPQSTMVNLARVETGSEQPETFLNESDLPNTRCSSNINAHGLKVRNCFDTIASAYIANIIVKSPSGQDELLTLTTRSRGTPEVFNAMVASVRSVP